MKEAGLRKLKNASELQKRKELEPGVFRLWEHFLNITHIPRQSGHEGPMTDFLMRFGAERVNRGVETFRDETGNVLMIIPSSRGCENKPKLILQGHQDMVCENIKSRPSPAENGVQAYVTKDGKRVKAKGTTLGADNGIGVSSLLSLADENIEHGQLALLFTVSEETGLDGVRKMKFDHDFTKYQALINIDSEDEGKATIGCAGGGNSLISQPIERISSQGKKLMRIELSGGEGGHSGIEIAKKRANALKELNSALTRISGSHKLNLVSLEAGKIENEVPVRNAIPSHAEAVIAINPEDEAKIRTALRKEKRLLKERFKKEKLGFSFKEAEDQSSEMMTDKSSYFAAQLINDLPHGVYGWQQKPDGGRMPSLSTNLAIVRTEAKAVKIDLMSRSSNDEALETFRQSISKLAHEYGAATINTDPYPAWNPPGDLPLYDFAKEVYKKLFNRKLKTSKTHGGLELGFFNKMWGDMPMLSIGPTIKDAHSVKESVLIPSVTRFYKYLTAMVAEMAR